jgi:hypothetical protein
MFDGLEDGSRLGATEGVTDGLSVGRLLGVTLGDSEGVPDGAEEGDTEGDSDGVADGVADGAIEGRLDGSRDGYAEGRSEGKAEGNMVGGEDGIDVVGKGVTGESLINLGDSWISRTVHLLTKVGLMSVSMAKRHLSRSAFHSATPAGTSVNGPPKRGFPEACSHIAPRKHGSTQPFSSVLLEQCLRPLM